MGPDDAPLYVHARRAEQRFTKIGIGCGILAAVGAAVAASSLVVRGRRPK
jgi:hypothetical protein